MNSTWLPLLVALSDSHGNWNTYVSTLYKFFEEDFVNHRPQFRGEPVTLKKQPLEQGKHPTFWHLISDGPIEGNRLPDMRRCERIRWPRAIIENVDRDCMKVWENTRKGDRRVCLYVDTDDYLVVLARRTHYVVLWTAYCVKYKSQKAKLLEEYRRSFS